MNSDWNLEGVKVRAMRPANRTRFGGRVTVDRWLGFNAVRKDLRYAAGVLNVNITKRSYVFTFASDFFKVKYELEIARRAVSARFAFATPHLSGLQQPVPLRF